MNPDCKPIYQTSIQFSTSTTSFNILKIGRTKYFQFQGISGNLLLPPIKKWEEFGRINPFYDSRLRFFF